MRPLPFKMHLLRIVMCSAVCLMSAPALMAQNFTIVSTSPTTLPMGSGATTVNVTVNVTNFPLVTNLNLVSVSIDKGAFNTLPGILLDSPPSRVIPVPVSQANLATAHTLTIDINLHFFSLTPGVADVDVLQKTSVQVYGPPGSLTLNPTSVVPGGGGFNLGVTGAGIQPAATVYWDDGSGTPVALTTTDSGSGLSAVVTSALVKTT